MKIPGVLLLLFVSGFFSLLRAQSQEQGPLSDSDQTIVQSWLEARQRVEARVGRDGVIVLDDDRDGMCAYLRVYRVKRDTPGSDLTRPAGYTTCVMTGRFQMKSSKKANRTP